MPEGFRTRKIEPKDAKWIKNTFIRYWGGDFIVSKGRTLRVAEFDGGYITEKRNKKVGLITYKTNVNELEITGLISNNEKKGIGTALVNSIITLSKRKGIKRIYLVTTNDNLNALGFWQRRGFNLLRVYPNSIEVTRKLKPSLPLIGENNIPLRDELELEMML